MVKVEDVIYFDEPLPDEVVAERCRVGRVKHDGHGKTRVKITLAKKTEGLWEERWLMER